MFHQLGRTALSSRSHKAELEIIKWLVKQKRSVLAVADIDGDRYICFIFTALHEMQTRSCDEISVCLSVCLSVRPSVRQTRAL